MKVLSFNVGIWTRNLSKNDYYWVDRAKAMRNMINDVKPDVICTQELIFPMTTYIPKPYKKAGTGISHHIYINTDTVKVKSHKFLYNIDYAYIEYKGHNKCIINVHSHWDVDKITKNVEQINEIAEKAFNDGYGDIVCCGDFNNSIDMLEHLSVKINLINVRQYLDLDVIDTFNHFYKESHAEIDFVYVSDANKIKSFKVVEAADTKYGVDKMSDHLPLLYIQK